MSNLAVENNRPILKAVAQWCRRLFDRPLDVQDPETAMIANDIGLSVSELECVSHLGVDSAEPMLRRMQSLGLDEEEIARTEPAVLHDLQRVCSFCDSKRQCQHEIRRDPDGVVWKTYCPNMPTFEGLKPGR